jgi:WD40 repeat protein
MNDEFLSEISPEDRAMSDALQSGAQALQVNTDFQSRLETSLKQAHPANKGVEESTRIRILPAIGWAIVALGALLILNWAVRSLVPNMQPAANGTPDLYTSFGSDVTTGNICAGQLAVVHDFSVFLSNQDKSSFIELDEGKNIDELRTFVWSPDGSQLAIVGNTRGSGNLYLTDPAGTQLQPILSNSELGYLMGVAWSRDGRQLLTWEIENNKRLYLLNKDGTGLTKIDLPLQFFETPQFAPDDESILFYGADTSTDGLFRVSIDGSQVELISDLVESESSFAWSPDGSRLAYIEMTSGSIKARLVIKSDNDEAATVTYPITVGTGISTQDSANLSWSPDGESIVLEFRGNGAQHIVNVSSWMDLFCGSRRTTLQYQQMGDVWHT